MVPSSAAALFLHSAAAPKYLILASLPLHYWESKRRVNIEHQEWKTGCAGHADIISRSSSFFGCGSRAEIRAGASNNRTEFCLNTAMETARPILGSSSIGVAKKGGRAGAKNMKAGHVVVVNAGKQWGLTAVGARRLFQPMEMSGGSLPRLKNNLLAARVTCSSLGTSPMAAAMTTASVSSSLNKVAKLGLALDFGVLQSSFATSINLVSLCTLVVWMQQSGQLPDDTPVILSQVAFRLFIPCFLLSKVATTLTESSASNLAALPLMAIIQVIIGAFLGKAASQVFFKVPSLQHAMDGMAGEPEQGSKASLEDQQKVTRAVMKKRALITAACAFGNSLTLPLVFLSGVLSTSEDVSRAAGYLALFMVGWSPAMWTVGYKILTSGDEVPESESVDQQSIWTTMINWIKSIMNPPLYGVLIGLLVGGTPLSHFFLKSKGGLTLATSSTSVSFVPAGVFARLRALTAGMLSPVFEAVALLGTATLAVQTVVLATSLGASLPKPNKASATISVQGAVSEASLTLGEIEDVIPKSDVVLDSKAFWAISFVRLILLPISGILLSFILQRYNLLPADPIYRLVILVESAMPTAQNLVLLAQLNAGTRPLAGMLAELLLRQYALSVFSLTMWMAIFLKFTPLP